MDGTSNSIESKLRQAWRQQRRFYNLRGASRFLIWLIFLLVLDFLIDWGIFFQTRMSIRIGFLLLVVNLVILGWVLWHEWLRHLKPFNPLLVALEVESRHPHLSSLIVSYTQLEGPSEKEPNVSVELIHAMRDEAVVQTRSLDFREIVDFGQLKKLLVVAAAFIVFFGVTSYINQGHLRILFQRLAGIDVDYPTETQIVEINGDMTVRIGDSVYVVARAKGVIPDEGTIYMKPADGDEGWKPLPLRKRPNQPAFDRELSEVSQDTLYYVRVGDAAQSVEYRIRVVPAPRVVSAKVSLEFPEYMKKESKELDQLNLEVPTGTKINWHLTCDSEIKTLLVKTDRKIEPDEGKGDKKTAVKTEEFEAEIDVTGKVATFALLADRGFKYTFYWTEDESGNEFVYDDVQYSVRVVADSIPEVALLSPSSDGLATVEKTAKLQARASDDHGLAKAWLIYTLDGSEETRVPIHDFKGAAEQTFDYSWKLKDSIKDLEPGVQIAFAVEVGDLNPSVQRQFRRSATRELTVVELERYLQWHRGELAAQRDEIKRVRDNEKTSSAQVKQLKDQETETP